jgi:hypothetical protein
MGHCLVAAASERAIAGCAGRSVSGATALGGTRSCWHARRAGTDLLTGDRRRSHKLSLSADFGPDLAAPAGAWAIVWPWPSHLIAALGPSTAN